MHEVEAVRCQQRHHGTYTEGKVELASLRPCVEDEGACRCNRSQRKGDRDAQDEEEQDQREADTAEDERIPVYASPSTCRPVAAMTASVAASRTSRKPIITKETKKIDREGHCGQCSSPS